MKTILLKDKIHNKITNNSPQLLVSEEEELPILVVDLIFESDDEMGQCLE